MAEAWDRILQGVLRPARAQLQGCREAQRQYLAALEDRTRGQARTLAEIENRITAARERVFASGSGVVPSEVTALEREWLAEARKTEPSQLDVLWKQVAPERWIASGRPIPESSEAVVTLASDADGVDAAERAAESLRTSLAAHDIAIGARVDWIVSRELTFAARAEELFAGVMEKLGAATHDRTQRAHRLRNEVRERLADRTLPMRNSSLARELGWLAFASELWGEAAPFAPLLEIYRLGYVPTGIDAFGVTLTAVPAL